MANVTTFQIPTAQVPRSPGENATGFEMDLSVVSGSAHQNDVVHLFVPPNGARFTGCMLSHDGTLGANATAQLKIGTVALTSATTQGGASTVVQNASDVNTANGTLTLNIVIAGADIAATTTIRVIGVMILPRG
jgi:hypothetical protein